MKGWTLDDVIARTKVTRPYRSTLPAPHLEPAASHAPLAAQKAAGLTGPLRLVVDSKLKRLRDADGTSAKYIVDSLVSAGILAADSPEVVAEVVHRQSKAETEETVVEIWRLE